MYTKSQNSSIQSPSDIKSEDVNSPTPLTQDHQENPEARACKTPGSPLCFGWILSKGPFFIWGVSEIRGP